MVDQQMASSTVDGSSSQTDGVTSTAAESTNEANPPRLMITKMVCTAIFD